MGRLPTPEEYMAYANDLDSMSAEIYRYMNFNEIQSFQTLAEDGQKIAATLIEEVA